MSTLENLAWRRLCRTSMNTMPLDTLCASLSEAWPGGGEIDPDEIRASTPENLPRMRSLGGLVLPRFAALCRDRGMERCG